MTAWLHIIGVGEAGVAELPASLRLLVNYAEAILGPARFLAELASVIEPRPDLASAELVERRSFEAIARALLEPAGEGLAPAVDEKPLLIEWQPPLGSMIEQVTRLRDTPTVILASGDPMWFGIGATLARHLRPEEFAIYPHPSAFQLAAARQRWPLQHLAAISLHGRPIETLHRHLFPGSRVLALTTDAGTAQQAAELLVERGYGDSRLTALESLGGPEERSVSATAAEFTGGIGDFYVLAIECVAAADAALLPAAPGLPDDAFQSDGQLTKREVRAATLARLGPFPGALLWDVGAGCGSIAIEWMRAARDAEAIAFEREPERLRMIAANAFALGVPGLRIEAGTVPQSLAGMPAPDAVFLGGGVADDNLFEACWLALKPGGRLVANAVTLDGEQALYARRARHGGDLVRIDVAVLDQIGGREVLRPRLPVTQWTAGKPQQPVILS